jgi:hypothetical protein
VNQAVTKSLWNHNHTRLVFTQHESSEEWNVDRAQVEKLLKELGNRVLITGFGGVDVGGFSSLAVSRTIEDLWDESKRLSDNGCSGLFI